MKIRRWENRITNVLVEYTVDNIEQLDNADGNEDWYTLDKTLINHDFEALSDAVINNAPMRVDDKEYWKIDKDTDERTT